MKELYTRPELEIERFETEDIITTSNDNFGGWGDWGDSAETEAVDAANYTSGRIG